jgi:hypothetical protein
LFVTSRMSSSPLVSPEPVSSDQGSVKTKKRIDLVKLCPGPMRPHLYYSDIDDLCAWRFSLITLEHVS